METPWLIKGCCPPPPPQLLRRLIFSLCAVALAVLLSGVAAAQTAGTITLSATNNNGDRDPATPGLQVDEGDIVTFTYTGNSLTELVGVDTVTTGTADSGIDYERILFPGTGLSVQRIFTPSNPGTSILVRVVNDSVAEDDETVIATLSNPVGFDTAPSTTTTIGTPGSVTITIRANDGSQAFLGGMDAQAAEGGTINVPVEFIGEARTAPSTVTFAITGTAASADYTVDDTASAITFDTTAATGTIEIAQTADSGVIPIRIETDAADAGETLIVTLTGHSGGGVTSTVSSAPRTYTLAEAAADTAPAFAAGVAPPDQTYTDDIAITALTLPEATGGNGTLSYSLTPVPAGLTFTDSTRILSGTPTAPAAAVTLTYTATDSDTNMAAGDAATLTFSVIVQGVVTISATGNNGDRDPATPGLQVDEGDEVTLTVTAHGLTAGSIIGNVRSSGSATRGTAGSGADLISDSGETWGFQTDTRTATGSTAILVHSVTDDGQAEADETATFPLATIFPSNPVPATTWIVGTPDSVTITIRANDGSVAMLGGADAEALGGGTITVPVEFSSSPARTADSTVAFAITGTAAATDYTVTTGGGITFDTTDATGTIEIAQADTSGAIPISIASGATVGRTLIVTLTGHSGGGVGSEASSAARTYTIAEADTVPAFDDTVDDQFYPFNAAITALTLPEATGGNGTLSYSLTPVPAGLTFTDSTRILSGTPTAPAAAVTLTYTATDSDANVAAGDAATLTFSVTVQGTVTISATNNNGDRDPATPGLQVDEGDIVAFRVTPNSITEAVIFNVTVAGTATSIADYGRSGDPSMAPGGEITLIPVSSSSGSNVLVADDSVAEDDETIIFALGNLLDATRNPSRAVAIGTPSSVTVTIRANDGSVAMLGGADAETLGGGTITVPVEFSSSPARTADSTVAFAITGTAAATDYTVATGGGITFDATPATGTIEIAQADTSGAIPISIASGATAGRTLIVTLTGHSGGGVGSEASSAPRTYTIAEADTAPTFDDTVDDQFYPSTAAITALTLPEATGGNGTLSYSLTPVPAGLTFTDSTRILSGTPTAVAAAVMLTYTATDSDTNMAAGDAASLTFSVTVQNTITISATNNNGDRDPATPGLQVDEGDIVTLTYTSNGLTNSVSVDVVAAGTATSVTDYRRTTSPGNAIRSRRTLSPAARIALTPLLVVDDSVAEDDETIIVTISNPVDALGTPITTTAIGTPNSVTITIRANDGSQAFLGGMDAQAAEGGTINVPVEFIGEARTAPSTVTFAITGTAASADYTVDDTASAITFDTTAATGTIEIAQTADSGAIPIGITTDAADAGETLIVTLTGHSSVGVTSTVSSAPRTYTLAESAADTAPAFAAGVAPPDQTYTDDIAITALTLPEATGGNGTLTYALTPVPAGLTFTDSTRILSGTPTAPAAAVMLTYTATDSDTNTDAADAASLTFSVIVQTAPIAGTPAVTISPTTLTVAEGNTATYTVVLTTDPGGMVTITPGIAPAGHGLTLTPGALTFTAANWNSAQVITVAAAEDADATDDTATITHAVTGYGSVTADPVTVTVADNGAPGVTITPTALTVPEGGTRTYTVVLDVLPSGNVVITPMWVNLGDTNVATFSPAALTFTPANWNSAQMVSVTGVEDPDAVADGPVTLTHMAVGGEYGTALSELEGVISPATSVDIDSVVVTVAEDDAGVTITPATLSVTEGGSGAYTVVLDALPGGEVTITPGIAPDGHDLTLTPTPGGALTFTAANWNSAQTITVAAAEDGDTVDDTATITHTVTGYGSVTADPVTVTITDTTDPDTAPAFAAGVAPPARTYTVGAITALTLPEATGGNGMLTYTLAPDAGTAVPGLAFDANTRIMSGTPTTMAGAVTLTYTAGDADANTGASDTATLTFSVTVQPAPAVTISPTTLAVAEGGAATYTVVLTTAPGGTVAITPGIAPPGHDLTLTPGGALTFTAANWNSAQTITVAAAEDGDSVDDAATITHAVTGYGSVTADPVTVTVTDPDAPDTAPAFAAGVAPPARTYTVGAAITALTLPEASGGNGALTYTLAPAVATAVPGLAFDANTRIVSGTPTTMAGAVALTYTAGDADANTAPTDTATLTFSVTVQVAPAVTISPTALTVAEGGSGTYTVVLTTDPGVPVTITPGIAPDGHDLTLTPGGALTFTAANWNSAQVVTVAAAEDSDSVDDAATITHAVTGYGSVTADPVTVTITDTTAPDTAPAFAAGVAPPAQTYTAGAAITLTLPPATGGNGALTYALAPAVATAVPGLAFDANTRIVSGTPTTMADAVALTYTAGDADANTGAGDTATLTFSVTVRPAPVVGTPAVTISPTTLTVAEGGAAIYTVVLTTAPGVPVTITPGIAPDGHDLTLTTGGALTFTAANWNSAQVVTVAAAQDTDNVDDAATITHAVTGYGSVTADPVTVTVTDSAPDFGAARVENQRYNVDTPITPLTLPTASGGDGTLSHVLTGNLPAGLTLPSGTLTLTGTPTAETLAVRLTWTATDAESQQTSLTFTLTVVDDADKAQRAALNRVILPEVARAMADDRVSAIARRIRQAGADSVEAGQTLTLGGQSTLAGVLTTHGRALAEGAFDLKTLLGGSDFVLPLNAREVAPGTGLSSVTLWGGGDYRAFSGKGGAINWDGNMFSAHLGADARLRDDLLAGVAVSWSEADLDYTDTGSGDYEVGLTSVHPYVGWTALGGRLDVWATAGYGWGELDITADDDTNDQRATSDVTMQTIGAGGSAQVFDGRAATLRIKGEALQTSMDVEGSEDITAVRIGARRLRLGLEASRTHLLAGGGQLVPTLEVGMRHDAGDGRTGTGAEVGGGMRYTDAANGLTVESHGRVLLGHSGDYQDWGIGGAVRLAAGRGGHGLSFSLQPAWGATASRASQVWAQEAATTVAAASAPVRQNGRVDMNLGYGLGWDETLVTPYSQVTLTNGSARAYRLGSRMRLGGGMTLNLEGIRQETAARLVNHGIRLQFGVSDRTTFSLEGTRKETATQALNHGITLQLGLDF